MAVPSSTITRFDLSPAFNEFDLAMNRLGFIGPQVVRPIMVGTQAADIGRMPLEALLSPTGETKRATGAGATREDFEWETWAYATEEHVKEAIMYDRQVRIYASIIDAESVHGQRAIDKLLRAYEIAVAAAISNTTTWTGADLTTAVTVPWSTHASATPIDDIEAGLQKVIDSSGLVSNKVVVPDRAFFDLINCDQVLDRIKYTQTAGQATMARAIAELLGVQEIVVTGRPGGLTNTELPQQSPSMSRIWNQTRVMIGRYATTPDPAEPCVGRTPIWTGNGPGGPGSDTELAAIVEEYRDEDIMADIIRARNEYQINIMYAEAQHLLTNIR